MIFTQPLFFAFFGFVYLVYWTLRSDRTRRPFLILMSYAFYACWDWRFMGLIFLSTVIDYFLGIELGKERSRFGRGRVLAASVTANLGILGFFKYTNFFIDSANTLLERVGIGDMPALNIVLPVGISFYTFQTMSYTIDLYWRRIRPVESFWEFALFISFFPQLVAGPIVRAATFLPQLKESRRPDHVRLKWALTLFFLGFVKKACVADQVAAFIDPIFHAPETYTAGALNLAYMFYAVQVYCDFSGYTDMAIATAGMLGYHIPLNFNYPFLAHNQSEFWQRWHISLTSWLRDYLYIPLGGSRVSESRIARNLILTFLASGLWHGALWTMVLFGLVHGLMMAFYRLTIRRMNPPRPWSTVLHVLGVPATSYWFAWTLILFRSEGIANAWVMMKASFTWISPGENSVDLRWLYLLIPIWGCHWLAHRLNPAERAERVPDVIFYFGLGCLIMLALLFVRVDYRPFVYFQF